MDRFSLEGFGAVVAVMSDHAISQGARLTALALHFLFEEA
jgi:hypothetical protein